MILKIYADSATRHSAIARNSMSAPAKMLFDKGLLCGRALDYGCGRGCDVRKLKKLGLNIEGFDPNFTSTFPYGLYDTIVSTYVLNVVAPIYCLNYIDSMLRLLKGDGHIYITVRRDISAGATWVMRGGKQDYCQYYVVLEAESIFRCVSFETYRLDASDWLCYTDGEILDRIHYVGL